MTGIQAAQSPIPDHVEHVYAPHATAATQPASLPPVPKGLAGTTHRKGPNYKLTVSNGNGYLAHISMESEWNTPPETIFAMFTYPDNSALFRDVKRVGNRKVVKSSPGMKVIDVEQVGELKVLWMVRNFSTWLNIIEDSRDADNMSIHFELQKSDVLAKFTGHWSLSPIRDASTGAVIGCRGVLEQDVLPNGVPLFMQKIPVLGGLLRGMSVRAIQRLMEDINAAVDKVTQGLAKGLTVQQVLVGMCGPCKAEEAYANGAIKSFAVDADSDEENDSGCKSAAASKGNAESLFVKLEVLGAEHVKLHLLIP